MSTFYLLWKNHTERAKYPTLSAFLRKHDPKGSAFQTTAKKMTGIPGKARVLAWSKVLKLSKEETADFLRAADYDRVLVAKDGEELGPGITMLMDKMLDLETTLSQREKEVASLRAQMGDLVAELKRAGRSLPESCRDL